MSDLATLAFEPGQLVKCKTRFDDVFEGEVVAFDLTTKVLVLKSETDSSPNHDLHFLVLDNVSDKSVEILEEPANKVSNDLPSINMGYVSARKNAAVSERVMLVQAVSNGVSHDGISLCTSLSKIFDPSSISWQDNVKIVVQNSVIISPPYKEADCAPVPSKTNQNVQAVNYVRSNVRKYWDGCTKQKVPT